jgi:hypothetical protein
MAIPGIVERGHSALECVRDRCHASRSGESGLSIVWLGLFVVTYYLFIVLTALLSVARKGTRVASVDDGRWS